MNLEKISTKSKKRVGRGISAGQGKTAGRGTKGQKARAGYDLPNRYEGGQTPLSMRLPKLPGFRSVNKKAVSLTLDQINAVYKDGETISRESLIIKGMIKNGDRAKIVNTGELKVAVILGEDVAASASVRSLFEKQPSKNNKTAIAKKTSTEAAAE